MTLRRLAIAALVVPLIAGCSSMLDNETIGPQSPGPSGGPIFASYVALGTSIGAGMQSNGLNDSLQKQAYPYLLAVSMGLTPGVDWFYPSLTNPGCPSPYTNILTSTRLSVLPCAYRAPGSVTPYVNNASVPSIRLAQVEKITRLDFGTTDTLLLAQFLVGSVNPIEMAERAHPTFITLEAGVNDVLGAATRGTDLLLTRLDSFQVQFTRLADRIDDTGAHIAVANVPNVTLIPHFSMGAIYYCLKNGGCPAPLPPATVPFSLPTFTVDASCAPVAPAVGTTTLVPFSTLGRILGALTAGGTASLNCGTGSATATGSTAAQLPIISPAELAVITQRVTDINTFIAAQATQRNWALVDFNGALGAQAAAGNIPGFPNLTATNPNLLMGTLFSQDGVHPSAAGHVLIANAFKAAINAKFGTSLP